jgi:carboxymethylenebutenolidase
MGETIKLTAEDGHAFDAYVAMPEGTPKGGVVVIQEIFGVNSHMRNDTDKFAAMGYAAIAPAVFDRVETGVELGYDEGGFTKGRGIVGELGFDGPLLDIKASAAHVAGHGKVGSVGYCWGGSVAWLTATRLGLPSVGYYGGRTAALIEEKPQAAVMLHFGEHDAAIPMDDVNKIIEAHPEVPVHIFDAGHGFNCDERGSFDAVSCSAALELTTAFLAEHVG